MKYTDGRVEDQHDPLMPEAPADTCATGESFRVEYSRAQPSLLEERIAYSMRQGAWGREYVLLKWAKAEAGHGACLALSDATTRSTSPS